MIEVHWNVMRPPPEARPERQRRSGEGPELEFIRYGRCTVADETQIEVAPRTLEQRRLLWDTTRPVMEALAGYEPTLRAGPPPFDNPQGTVLVVWIGTDGTPEYLFGQTVHFPPRGGWIERHECLRVTARILESRLQPMAHRLGPS